MKIITKENKEEIGLWVADYIANKINEKPSIVLGLPTGSTPLLTYKALINLYRTDKVSLREVVTFNMDEYIGLKNTHPQSYYYFMFNNFFDYTDINKNNINILDGMSSNKHEVCLRYEAKIKKSRGIDLQLGGIGSNGHIAFNEPGSSFDSITREVFLDKQTIQDNSRFFNNNLEETPKSALSIGLGTIMAAKEIIIIATGKNKAEAVGSAIEGEVSEKCPASILQNHKEVTFICDSEASSFLTSKHSFN